MKQKNKILLSVLIPSLAVGVSAATITAIAVGCKYKNDEYNATNSKNFNYPEVNLSNNIIPFNEKIKYVAIGDSISAGYTNFLPEDYPGDMDENGNITGASFPAYLAQIIKNENPQRLASFDNFSFSGATSHELIKAFNWSHFPKNDIEPTDASPAEKFAELKNLMKEKIQKANLITINFGANDFFEIFSTLLKKDKYKNFLNDFKKDKVKAIFNLWYIIGEANEEIKNRFDVIIREVKALNKNANIMLISYPMPFNRLTKVIDSIILGLNGISNSVINILNEQIIKPSALKNNVLFLNVYDQPYWNEHQSKLTQSIFDIHPTLFGWKKMAMDAYIKLSTGYTSLDVFKEKINYELPWNYNFVDNKDALKVIDHSKSDTQVLLDAFKNMNYEEFLYDLNKDDLYNADEVKIKWNNKTQKYERTKTGKKIKDIYKLENHGKRLKSHALKWTIDKVIENLESWDLFKQLADKDQTFIKLMKEKTNGKDNKVLFRELFDVKDKSFLENLINDFQKHFDQTDYDLDGKIGGKYIYKHQFLDRFLISLLDGENNFKNLMVPFLESDLYKNNKDKWKIIFESILTKYNDSSSKFINEIIDLYFDFIHSNDEFTIEKVRAKKYFLKFFNNKNINNFLKQIVNYTFKNDSNIDFLKKQSFYEVLDMMLTDSSVQNDFKNSIIKLIDSFVNDKEFVDILSERILLYKLFKNKEEKNISTKTINDPDNLLGITKNSALVVTKRIVKYFEWIKTDSTVKEKFVQRIIDTLKSNKKMLFLDRFFHELELKTLVSDSQYEELKKMS